MPGSSTIPCRGPLTELPRNQGDAVTMQSSSGTSMALSVAALTLDRARER